MAECGIPRCEGCAPTHTGNGVYSQPLSGRDVEITKEDGSKFVLKDVELTVHSIADLKAEAQGRLAELLTPGPLSWQYEGFRQEEENVTDYDQADEEPQLADWEKIAERRQDDAVVYISGPMRGYPEHNYPAFNEAAQILRHYGYEVVNPAENFEGRVDLPQETYLRVDVGVMAERCNAIFFLPGWQNSAGARLEWQVAKSLGFDVVNEEIEGDETDTNLPVEYEASSIVRNGERQMNYGHPNQDFARTAGMWTAFLAHKLVPGAVITMEEMALMMGQLKMSRLASTPGHHDSIVDLIGYAICYDRLGETA